jgi:hypothetical protein
MVEVAALVCIACGGPLDAANELPAVVECGYCGAALTVARDTQTITRPATPSDRLDALAQKRAAARPQFVDELGRILAAGASPYLAVRNAWALHLSFEATAEPIARLTVALARDFERESGVKVVDANALARIAEAYLKAIGELRAASETELNLPFLVADASGPHHLLRRVTPQLFAELARRDPEAGLPLEAAPHAPPAAPPSAPAPTKRKKLFGLF